MSQPLVTNGSRVLAVRPGTAVSVPKRWVDALGRINHYLHTYQDNGLLVVLSKTWRSRKRRWEYLATPQDLVLYEIRIRKTLKCHSSQ